MQPETIDRPAPLDPIILLPRRVYSDLVQTLIAQLPPPVTDTPEARRDRNTAAIVKIADQHPVNAFEADLAAQYVIARAQSGDIMRQIRALDGDFKTFARLQGLYNGLLRLAMSARGHLQRAQAKRHQREDSNASCKADEWTHHIALMEMQRALDRLDPAPEPAVPLLAAPLPEQEAAPPPAPPVPAEQDRATPRPVAPAEAAAPPPVPVPPPAPVPPQAAAPRDIAAEAEQYGVDYPRRAFVIRRHGGRPPYCDFDLPDEALIRAIVASRSKVFAGMTVLARESA